MDKFRTPGRHVSKPRESLDYNHSRDDVCQCATTTGRHAHIAILLCVNGISYKPQEARLQATADELPSGEAIVNNDHDLQEEMNEGSKKRRLDGEAVNPESATVDHSISRAADASMQGG